MLPPLRLNVKIIWMIAILSILMEKDIRAQNQKVVDSLTALIQSAPHDTLRIRYLYDLAWHYRDSDPEKFHQLTDDALKASNKQNYLFGIAKGYILNGIMNTIQGNFDQAEKDYLECKKVREKMHDTLGVAAVLNNIGTNHLYQGNLQKAMDYFIQSLRIEESCSGSAQHIAQSYVNIGDVYMGMKEFDKAIEYFNKYMEVNKGLGNIYSVPEVFANLGNAWLRKGDWEKAFFYFTEGVNVCRETGNLNTKAACLAGLGMYYAEKEIGDTALVYLKRAVEIHERIGNLEALTHTLNEMGNTLMSMKREDEAIGVLYKSVSIGREIGAKKTIADSYKTLAAAYEKKKDFQNAFEAEKYYNVYTDSVLTEENSRNIAEMEAKYRNEKAERENLQLVRENETKELEIARKQNLIYLISGITGITLLGSLFVYNRKKLRQQRLLNDEIRKQESLRLKAIINTQEEEQKRIAAELHDGLGSMLSAARINLASIETDSDNHHQKIKTTLETIDDSCRELRNISYNMMPALLVKSGLFPALNELTHRLERTSGIRFSLDHDPSIPEIKMEVTIHLYRIVQELINNIIKYAEATEVHISANIENRILTLMVEDNGKGFNTDELKNSKGNGWYNILSRLKLIHGAIEMDSKTKNGTVAAITLPV